MMKIKNHLYRVTKSRVKYFENIHRVHVATYTNILIITLTFSGRQPNRSIPLYHVLWPGPVVGSQVSDLYNTHIIHPWSADDTFESALYLNMYIYILIPVVYADYASHFTPSPAPSGHLLLVSPLRPQPIRRYDRAVDPSVFDRHCLWLVFRRPRNVMLSSLYLLISIH